jgi:hypothetical protein
MMIRKTAKSISLIREIFPRVRLRGLEEVLGTTAMTLCGSCGKGSIFSIGILGREPQGVFFLSWAGDQDSFLESHGRIFVAH